MEEAVDHRLAKERADQGRRQLLAVVLGGNQRLAVAELDPVEPFERQHPSGGSAPVDLGYVVAGFGDHVLTQLGSRSGFALKVELPRSPLAEVCNHQTRSKPLGFAAI